MSEWSSIFPCRILAQKELANYEAGYYVVECGENRAWRSIQSDCETTSVGQEEGPFTRRKRLGSGLTRIVWMVFIEMKISRPLRSSLIVGRSNRRVVYFNVAERLAWERDSSCIRVALESRQTRLKGTRGNRREIVAGC